jgi:hypothetical protein
MTYHVTAIVPQSEAYYLLYVGDSLEAVQDALGATIEKGYLELVPHFERYGSSPCVVFCHEEGKLRGFPLNSRATYLWYAAEAQRSLCDRCSMIPDEHNRLAAVGLSTHFLRCACGTIMEQAMAASMHITMRDLFGKQEDI